MKKNLKLSLFAGANLAANGLAGMMSASPSPAIAQSIDTTATQVNAMTVASIEQSFLKVPGMCKARSAAFDPRVVGSEVVSEDALAIHAALEGDAGVVA